MTGILRRAHTSHGQRRRLNGHRWAEHDSELVSVIKEFLKAPLEFCEEKQGSNAKKFLSWHS